MRVRAGISIRFRWLGRLSSEKINSSRCGGERPHLFGLLLDVFFFGGIPFLCCLWRSKQSEWVSVDRVSRAPDLEGHISFWTQNTTETKTIRYALVVTTNSEKGRNATKQQTSNWNRSDVNGFSRLVMMFSTAATAATAGCCYRLRQMGRSLLFTSGCGGLWYLPIG